MRYIRIDRKTDRKFYNVLTFLQNCCSDEEWQHSMRYICHKGNMLYATESHVLGTYELSEKQQQLLEGIEFFEFSKGTIFEVELKVEPPNHKEVLNRFKFGETSKCHYLTFIPSLSWIDLAFYIGSKNAVVQPRYLRKISPVIEEITQWSNANGDVFKFEGSKIQFIIMKFMTEALNG